MAPLPPRTIFGIRAWLYEWELQRLWQSYEAANGALAYQRRRLERDLEERSAALTPEDDPDLLDDLDREYEELSGRELPSLFLIGMYHAFERHAARWMKRSGEQVTFKEISRWFVSGDHPLNLSALSAVSLAANCAKHGAGKSAKRLFKLRPNWFRDGTTDSNADDARLQITPDRLREMYETLRSATPRKRPSPI